MSERDGKKPMNTAGWGMKPIIGIGLAYLVSSTVAGLIISLSSLGSDYSDATKSPFIDSFGFLIAGLFFTTILALIAFVPLRFAMYYFRISSLKGFAVIGALEGGVAGFIFLQGFLLSWAFVLAGAVAGATQWILEKRFVGKISTKPEMTPIDE